MNSRRLVVLALLAAAMFLPALISPAPVQAYWEWGCVWQTNDADVTPRAVIMEPDGSAFTTFSDYAPHDGGADIQITKWGTEPPPPCSYWNVLYDSPLSFPDYVKAAARATNGAFFVVGYTDKTSAGKGFNLRVVKYSPDGIKKWEQGYNHANKDDVAEDVAIDYGTAPDSIYVAGWQTNADDTVNLVLQRYAPNSRNPVWTVPFNLYDASVDLAAKTVFVGVDGAGYVYLAGTVWETGVSGTHETWLVAKYDGNGNLLDHTTWGSCWKMRDFAVDPAGNCYATGWFTVSWDSSLDERWSYSGLSGGEYHLGLHVALDGSGNCFVSGTTPSGQYWEPPFLCYVMKFNTAGDTVWTPPDRTYDPGSGATAEVKSMAVDSGGNVVVAGEQSTGDGDWFAARWDADGNLIWAEYLYGWIFPEGGSGPDSAMGVATDPSNNVYVTGYMQYRLDDWDIEVLKHTPGP